MSIRPPDMMRGVLAVLLVGAFMTALSWLFRNAIPTANEQLVTFMLGQLSGFAGAAVAYYLGTSKSSNDKDEMLRLPPPDRRLPESRWEFEPDPLDPARERARTAQEQD
jgi:hypothetical protein